MKWSSLKNDNGAIVVDERGACVAIISGLGSINEPGRPLQKQHEHADIIAAAPQMQEALSKLEGWLVCAAISTPEDMMQAAPEMLALVESALSSSKGA